LEFVGIGILLGLQSFKGIKGCPEVGLSGGVSIGSQTEIEGIGKVLECGRYSKEFKDKMRLGFTVLRVA